MEHNTEVSKWLDQIGLSELRDLFKKLNVPLSTIENFTEDDLVNFGVDKKARRKLLPHIKKLKGNGISDLCALNIELTLPMNRKEEDQR
jgi:hypothetical protein